MTKRNLACLALALCLTGCQGGNPIPPGVWSTRTPIAALVGYSVHYLYKDNWSVDETKTGGDKFHLTLKKNVLRENGNSESDMIFKRRAAEIAAEQGYDGYRIMEYSEGIDSTTFGAQRVAQGVIECYKETGRGK